MKRKQLLLMLWVSALLLVSCNDDDSNTTHPLDGSWHLVNVSGGFPGESVDYADGEVTWTFHVSAQSLQVENLIDNTGPQDIHAGYETGTYTISVTTEDEVHALYVNNELHGMYTVNGNTLTIDDGLASDGYVSTYER